MSHPPSPLATHLPEVRVDVDLAPPRHAIAACPPTPAKRRYVPVDPLLKATVWNAQQLLTAAQAAHAAHLDALAESVAEAVRADVASGILAPPLENPIAVEDALAAHANAAAHNCYLLEYGDRGLAILALVLAEYGAPVDYAGAIYLGIRSPQWRTEDEAALLIHSHANQTCRRLGLTAKVSWFELGLISVRDEILRRVAGLADGTPNLHVHMTGRLHQRRLPIWVGEPEPAPAPLPTSRRKGR